MSDSAAGIGLSSPIVIAACVACVLVAAVAVYFDARSNGARRGLLGSFPDWSPGGWFAATLLFSVILVPVYLLRRGAIRRAATEEASRALSNTYRTAVRQASLSHPEYGSTTGTGPRASGDEGGCPHCGTLVPRGTRRCPNCGRLLG